jgi:methenyltetrahydromethanopterin cyclohydrolase
MSKQTWRAEDGVALRQFFKNVSQEKLSDILKDSCPVDITAKVVLENDAEAVARLASMKAGWEAYGTALFALAGISPSAAPEAPYKDMT